MRIRRFVVRGEASERGLDLLVQDSGLLMNGSCAELTRAHVRTYISALRACIHPRMNVLPNYGNYGKRPDDRVQARASEDPKISVSKDVMSWEL